MSDFDLAMLQSQVNALQKWMSDLSQNMAGLDLRLTGIEQQLLVLEAEQHAEPIDINAAPASRLISGIEPGESPTAAPVIPPG